MTRSCPVRIQVAQSIVALTCVCAIPTTEIPGQDLKGPPDSKRTAGEDDAKQLRKTRLDEMRRLAEGTAIFQLAAGERKSPVKLVAEPVLRYSGEFHSIVDATAWIYGMKGRPVAVQKIELYRAPWHRGYYYCLASLCDDRIEARWAGYPGWSSTKPGVEMRPLPGAPKPAPTDAARTRQIKEVVRRFTATRINAGNIREENRLLAQPIHRYRDPESGLVDGALFAFIANGTNPDFVLLIELRGANPAQAVWQYGAARMTTGELHLRLDGKEVWSVPWEWVSGRNEYPTYVHFPVH